MLPLLDKLTGFVWPQTVGAFASPPLGDRATYWPSEKLAVQGKNMSISWRETGDRPIITHRLTAGTVSPKPARAENPDG